MLTQTLTHTLPRHPHPNTDTTIAAVAAQTEGYASAELELVVLAASALASDDERSEVTSADLERAVGDVIPSRDPRMLDYMEMLAVFESCSRRMLPPRYAEMETHEVQSALDSLRAQLGRRVL